MPSREYVKDGEPWLEITDEEGRIVMDVINIPVPEQAYAPPVDLNQELRDMIAAQQVQIETLLAALGK